MQPLAVPPNKLAMCGAAQLVRGDGLGLIHGRMACAKHHGLAIVD